jgi:hypothetical protein
MGYAGLDTSDPVFVKDTRSLYPHTPGSGKFNERVKVSISTFAFWVLQESDPMGYGEIVSPDVNHRRSDQTAFKKLTRKGKKNAAETLMENSDDCNEHVLQTGPIVSMPYAIGSNVGKPEYAQIKVLSPAAFHWNGDENTHNRMISADGVVAKQVANSQYKALAHFFGYHLPGHKTEMNNILSFDDPDFTALMTRLSPRDEPIHNIKQLNKMLTKICYPFRYVAELEPARAFTHFAAIFRSVTGIRFAQLEGGHRTFVINRVFQGYTDESTIPLRYNNRNEMYTGEFPTSGTLAQPLDMRIVHSNEKDNFITKDTIARAKIYSAAAQKARKSLIKFTFNSVIREAMNNIAIENEDLKTRDYYKSELDITVESKKVGRAAMAVIESVFSNDEYIEEQKGVLNKEHAIFQFGRGEKHNKNLLGQKIISPPKAGQVSTDYVDATLLVLSSNNPSYHRQERSTSSRANSNHQTELKVQTKLFGVCTLHNGL